MFGTGVTGAGTGIGDISCPLGSITDGRLAISTALRKYTIKPITAMISRENRIARADPGPLSGFVV